MGRWFGLRSAMASADSELGSAARPHRLLGEPPLGAPRPLEMHLPPELKLPPRALPPHDGLVAPSLPPAAPPAADRPPPPRHTAAAPPTAAAAAASAEGEDFSPGEAIARDAARLAQWAKREKEALAARNGGLSLRDVWQLLEEVQEQTCLHADEARKVLLANAPAPAPTPAPQRAPAGGGPGLGLGAGGSRVDEVPAPLLQ
jgi:hypothetical protein